MSKIIFYIFTFFVLSNSFSQTIEPPLITHLSIDSITNQVQINWANSSPQTEGYIVYKRDYFGLWIPLDTIFGIDNTFYVTNSSNAQNQIETFSITAFDGNDNSSLRSDFHQTTKLEYDYQNCNDTCFLSWNGYHNMFGLVGYRVLINSKNNLNGQTSFQEITLGQNDTTLAMPVDYSTSYSFYIAAFNIFDSLSVSTNSVFSTTNLKAPEYIYINRVSVNSENTIDVSIISDSSDISYYKIYRSFLDGGFPNFLGITDSVTSPNSYRDLYTYPQLNKYYYSAIAVDVCGNELSRSKYINSVDTSIVSNLKLTPLILTNKEISVEWDDYEGFLNPNYTIELWKGVNNNFSLLNSVSPFSSSEIDISDDIGEICIFLKAYENDVNLINRQDTIYSNRVCVANKPLVYIPNSFSPNEDMKNNLFKVYLYDNGSLTSFKLDIYDSLGNIVFQTNDENEYWDGTFKGKVLPIDNYVYMLKITYANDYEIYKNGNITLLR